MNARRILSDEDGAWKAAVREYPREFLEYCFPETAQQIDFEQGIAFLDKEFPRDRSMKGMTADLLMEAAEKQTNTKMLLHLEVQGKKEDNFEQRMAEYTKRIEYESGMYPTSLLVLTDTDMEFQPESFRQTSQSVCFRVDFSKVKVVEWGRDLDELEEDAPLFAVFLGIQKEVSLMRSTRAGDRRRYEVKRDLLIKLSRLHRSSRENASLLKFIDRLIQLAEKQEMRLKQELSCKEDIVGLVDLFIEDAKKEGEQRGIQKGIHQGMERGTLTTSQTVLINVMKKKFSLNDAQLTMIRDIRDTKKLERAIEAVVFAENCEEVFKELK